MLLLLGFEDSFQRGLAALRLDHLQEAVDAFTAAEKANPRDPRVHNFLGIALMSTGNTNGAAAEYLRATQLNGEFEDAFRNLGYLEWVTHNYAQARSHLEQALHLAPKDRFAVYYLARVEMDDHQAGRSVTRFESLGDPLDIALAYLYAGRYQDSARIARSIPPSADASTILGVAEAKSGNEKAAVAALQKAAELNPGREEHWLNLACELMGATRYKEARASVESGLQANPKSYTLQLRLGAVDLALGDYSSAEKIFRDLVEAGDPLPASTVGLTQVLLRSGRADEAVTLLRLAEKRLGPQFLLLYFEGLALDRSGDTNSALAAFRRSVEANPENAEARFAVGRVALKLGQAQQAAGEFQTVLRLQPENAAARRLLRLAYARAGDKNVSLLPEVQNESTPPSLTGDFILPDWRAPSS
jgi:Flp pilus assembly protein TadD